MSKIIKYGSDCTGLDASYIALKHLLPNVINIFASDIDQHVREMLNANHKIKNIYESVEERPSTYVDIYFAGFPCQTFSTAGSRSGFEDVRGTVFFDIYQHLIKSKPKIVILENVKGLLTHDNGHTFSTIMNLLSELKCYNIYHQVLSPHTHGNWPQFRPRIFIVCICKSVQTAPFEFPTETPLTNYITDIIDHNNVGDIEDLTDFEYKNLNTHRENMMAKGVDIMNDYYIFDIGASVAFGKPRLGISPTLKASRSNYYISKLRRKLTLEEIRQVQGLPEMKIVVSERQYMKQIGNSVCIPVLIRLFKSIFQCTNI